MANRLMQAFSAFWTTLRNGASSESVTPALASSRPTSSQAPTLDLRILALLQRDGRLLDFLGEDLEEADDDQIAAAATEVHRLCRGVLHEYLTLEPILQAEEDTSTQVPEGFDASTIRLIGNVGPTGPQTGLVRHRGWKVTSAKVPDLPHAVAAQPILAQAEVEVS